MLFDFIWNLTLYFIVFNRKVTNRKEHSANYLPDENLVNKKVIYESENSIELNVINKTSHRSNKNLKAKSFKSEIFN